jgi:CheY-like chemotaxis protein
LRGNPTDGNGGARMKLIALTGYGADSDLDRATAAGFDGRLVKPCTFDELEELIISHTIKRKDG